MKKIAIAVKSNGKKVEHFGICEYFVVYNYDEKSHDITYDNVIYSSKEHKNDTEEWEKSAESIKNCDIVICERIGMIAKVELDAMGIKVIENSGQTEEVLDKFLDSEIRKDNIILP